MGGQAGSSINGGAGTINNGGLNISAPTLTGTLLPAAVSPQAVSDTPPGKIQPASLNGVQGVQGITIRTVPGGLPARSIQSGQDETAPVPNIGGKATQDGLKVIGDQTGAINKSLGGEQQGRPGGEHASSIGSGIFDGAQIKKTEAPDQVTQAVAYVERYIRGIAGSSKIRPDQRRALFEMALEEKRIALDSQLGKAVEARMYPETAQKKAAGRALISPRFAHFADTILAASERYNVSTQHVEALIKKYPDVESLLVGERSKPLLEKVLTQILERDRVEGIVKNYPANSQGELLRSLAQDILAPSGKSIEETSRAGAFIYVNFYGSSVRSANTGRDPDNTSPDRVFYATLEPNGTWKIGGYRNNGGPAGSDPAMVENFKNWLISGGIPKSAFTY